MKHSKAKSGKTSKLPSRQYFEQHADSATEHVKTAIQTAISSLEATICSTGTCGWSSDKASFSIKIGERTISVPVQVAVYIPKSKNLPESTGIKTTADTIG